MNILKTLWGKWKKLAKKIGTFQSRVILTIFYFSLLLPVSIVFTLLKDALEIKSDKKSFWQIRKDNKIDSNTLNKQY